MVLTFPDFIHDDWRAVELVGSRRPCGQASPLKYALVVPKIVIEAPFQEASASEILREYGGCSRLSLLD